MKKLLTILYLVISISTKAQIDYAFENAKSNTDYSSYMTFDFSDKVSIKKLKSWINANGNSINSFTGKIINDEKYYKYETKTEFMFGTNRTFVTKLQFLKTANVQLFANYWKVQQDLASQRQSQQDALAILGAGIALKLGWEGLKWIGKNIAIPSGSSTDEQRRQIAINYQQEQCNDCEVNFEKTIFPKDEKSWIGYSHKFGTIVMKNKKEYTFDYDQGKYTISTGWFSSNKYDTFTEMLSVFLKKCKQQYCR